jgi:hypothetical protein
LNALPAFRDLSRFALLAGVFARLAQIAPLPHKEQGARAQQNYNFNDLEQAPPLAPGAFAQL